MTFPNFCSREKEENKEVEVKFVYPAIKEASLCHSTHFEILPQRGYLSCLLNHTQTYGRA